MKEATGELNMTVITVIIIAALAAVATTVIVPMVSGSMRNQTCEGIMGEGATAVKSGSAYWCCPAGVTGANAVSGCQRMD